ncbi:MAG: cytochrome P450 [Rhodobacteraceae bacterium]|nr:cytochrome P450 [Paracoccaceae bacterium]
MTVLGEFNALTSTSFRHDPYPLLARLRDEHPVLRMAPGLIESYHVFGYEDIRGILTRPETFSSDRSLLGGGDLGDANLAFLFNNMISAGGDKHRRLRMIGNRVFMPKFIERFRPAVEAVVAERLDWALGAGEIDLVEDFAAEITVAMITAVLGLPREDMRDIRRWTAVLGENSGAATWLATMDPAILERGRRTGIEMTDYFSAYLADRRAHPREGDLISDFMAVEVDGERLSQDEILSMAMLLLLAGNETTTNLIVNFLRLCDAFPDASNHLRGDPALTVPAVEETLRLRNSIRNIDRYALEDVDVSGVRIPAGGLVVLWLTAGNRDPRAFPEPDRFDPERYLPDRAANRHLAFGAGPHFCLGAPLARMETQIAVKAVLERTRGVEMTEPPSFGGNASFDNVTRQMARLLAA